MDLTDTIVPDSTQINADDLIASPITVTIESVSAGNAEQPVNINTIETPGRAYRPSKSMRRVLVAAWGTSAGYLVTLIRLCVPWRCSTCHASPTRTTCPQWSVCWATLTRA